MGSGYPHYRSVVQTYRRDLSPTPEHSDKTNGDTEFMKYCVTSERDGRTPMRNKIETAHKNRSVVQTYRRDLSPTPEHSDKTNGDTEFMKYCVTSERDGRTPMRNKIETAHKQHLVVPKSCRKRVVASTMSTDASKTIHLKGDHGRKLEQNNETEQNENYNLEHRDVYKGLPAEWTLRINYSPTPEHSDKTNGDTGFMKNCVTSERAEEHVLKIDSVTHENHPTQEQTLNESKERDWHNDIDMEAHVDNSENRDENLASAEATYIETLIDQVYYNGVYNVKNIDILKAKTNRKNSIKQRRLHSEKQHVANNGKHSQGKPYTKKTTVEPKSYKRKDDVSPTRSDAANFTLRTVETKTDAKVNAKQQEANSGNTNTEKKPSDSGWNANLMFYSGKITSRPFPGYKIVEMLKWKGDFAKLESNYSYIQWLFPIPESSGMNHSAQPLQEHEAKAIKNDGVLKMKVLRAFEMMLDFYGMTLQDNEKGKFERSQEWMTRYAHLNKSVHNYLRITRILKSLGELGWEHLQSPWLEFLMEEAADEQGLPRLANSSSVEYWIHAIKDESKQAEFFERFHKLKTGLTTVEPSENKKKDAGKPDKQNETQPPSNQQSSTSNHESFSKDTKSNETSSINVEKNLRSF